MPAVLLPNGKQAFFTTPGVPAVGYKLMTWAAGTTTPQTTWADALKVAANANPIVLDARGEAVIFWDGAYKIQLQDSTGAPVWPPIDNVQSSPAPSGSLIPTVDNSFTVGSPAFSWANMYVGVNHAPVLDPVSGNIGYYIRTPAELAAGVTPVNLAYPPGNPWRYGADGAGGAADIAALATASTILNTIGVNGWRNGSPIGGFLRTAAEIAASVLSINYSYGTQPYDIRRYGALLNNVHDDTSALNTGLLVGAQIAGTALGSAISVTTGASLLSSLVPLPNRVRVLGLNKRGSYFQAMAGWASGATAYNAGTSYGASGATSLVLVSSGGLLYSSKQSGNLGNTPASNPAFWNPISPAMFYAQNGYTAGVGNSMFDSTLENLTVDCNNVAGVGGLLSSAWQDDCGMRSTLVTNFGTYGIKYQDAFGGADVSFLRDVEIFAGTAGALAISGITQAASAVVTVSTVSILNPFTNLGTLYFSGIVGMTQMNGLFGVISAIGGVSGAWTATVAINSLGFTAYSSGGTANGLCGIDLSTSLGAAAAFMLDIYDVVISGGTAPIAIGINCYGNSLYAHGVHFETCQIGFNLDGNGTITLDNCDGRGDVSILVNIAYSFTGTLVMNNCKRNGSTAFIQDNRVAQIQQFGAITGGTLYTNGTYGLGGRSDNANAGVPLTGGTGTNATAIITVAGGSVTSVAIVNPGKNYVVGDVLSVAAANVGGTGSGFSIPVFQTFTGYGTISSDFAYWTTDELQASGPKSMATASAWCTFDGTKTGTNAPAAGYNVLSVTRTGAGTYTVLMLRPMLSAQAAPIASCNLANAIVNTNLIGSTSFGITIKVAGANTDSNEVKVICFGG